MTSQDKDRYIIEWFRDAVYEFLKTQEGETNVTKG